MPLLDKTYIQTQLHQHGLSLPFRVHIFSSIDSTNQYLKTLPKECPLEICCAETQTQGRGRWQRTWHSPDVENIYCSVRWHYDVPNIPHLSTLGLVVALSITNTLTRSQIPDLSIKWPNDILWHGKKLCGILIESHMDPQGMLAVVIGFGINVNIQPHDPRWQNKIEQPWCSLREITGRSFDRNPLLVDLLIDLIDHLQQHGHSGFALFKAIWEQWDHLRGKMVTAVHMGKEITGIVLGISDQGELMIEDNQQIHYIRSGETTLQRV